MNETDNNLWHYSAKIFTYIDLKLDLLSTLRENHGKFPSNDDFQQLDHVLQVGNNPSYKVERLLTNRLHLHLMRNARGDEIDQQLTEYYTHFEQNLYAIQNLVQTVDLSVICFLAWLKYYAHIYSFALSNDSHEPVL
ncbi:unnamed protein product, partial [Adineta ricciae]